MIRARALNVAGSVITAILVLPVVPKGACRAVSISICMEGEFFEGRIMRRILTTVSGPRTLSRLLRSLERQVLDGVDILYRPDEID